METLRLPSIFVQDQLDRDLDVGVIIKQNKRWVWVEMTPRQKAEMVSDAEFYAEDDVNWCEYVRKSLQPAAKRLLAHLT